MKTKFAVILMGLVLAGCSGGAPQSIATLPVPAVVVAGGTAPSTAPQISSPIYAHPIPGCPTGCFAADAPKYLNLRLGPFTTENYQESQPLILTHAMNVVLIDGWMGTDAGASFEADAHLEIQAADGSLLYEFQLQHDKHQDTIGNVSVQRYVRMTLPAGTRFVLFHGPGYSVSGQPLSQLHADAMFRLYGE